MLLVLSGFWYSPCAGVGSEMDRDLVRTESTLEEGAVVGGQVPEREEGQVLVVVEVILVLLQQERGAPGQTSEAQLEISCFI